MQIKSTSINPEGRAKYGRSYSSKNTRRIATSIVNSTTTTPYIPKNESSIFIALSKNNCNIEGKDLRLNDITDSINVLGFLNDIKVPTYIGDLSTTTDNPNYDIVGKAINGMTINVNDNGTTDTTIVITYSADISVNVGTLYIPINIYSKDTYDLGTIKEDWVDERENIKTLVLEYTWNINQSSSSAYILELTNDSTQINCDKDGNIYADAERPTCEAKLFYGTELVEDATFEIEVRTSQNVQGVTMESNVITFDSTFNFDGMSTEIKVKARYLGEVVGEKIMTITKSFAGADGYAISRWIVPSVDSVIFNPNDNIFTPTIVTAEVWKQLGTSEPELDTDSTLYYGFDTETPTNAYITGVTISNSSWNYLRFALKNASNNYYVSQTISLLKNGTNGTEGTSPYILTLTNPNTSIACDSSGNFLPNAVMPTCTATLWKGNQVISNVDWFVQDRNTTYSGISLLSNGEIEFDRDNLSWSLNYPTLEITIAGRDRTTWEEAIAIFTISRNYSGANGENAINYYIDFNYNQVKIDNADNITPSILTATAYKQIGTYAPEEYSDGVIKYSYDTPILANLFPTNGLTTTNAIGHEIICIGLYTNANVLLKRYTIPIISDGKNGRDGNDGNDGRDGDSGLQGPAIRGPIDYWSQDGVTPRRWSNGHYSDGAYPEDALYIDIILKDGKYYYCNTSHTAIASASAWEQNKTYWTEADNEFNFVATQILLAHDARINFLTNNQLLMVNANGDVTAGMKGGDDINFWAGSMIPADGNLQIWNDGTIIAKKGTFGCLDIVENPNGYDALVGTWNSDDGNDTTTEYSQRRIRLENTYQNDTKVINIEADGFSDVDGDLTIKTTSTDKNYSALFTDGNINSKNIRTEKGIGVGTNGFGLNIRFIATSNKFNLYNGNICLQKQPILLNDRDLRPITCTSSEFNTLTNRNGEWNITKNGNYLPLGVYASTHTKENGILYITL